MVEMIMVLPLLLFVMFAIVELSRAWYTLHLTTTAVREGARAAAVATNSTAVNEGGNRLNFILNGAGITPTSTNIVLQNIDPLCTVNCDQQVIASASVSFHTIFPVLIPQLQTINMSQTATMRFECGSSC